MHIVFIKSYDIWLVGREYVVERTLGARLCELKVAIPYSKHLDNQAEAKRKAGKAATLLKEKAEKAKETADSKPAKTRSKSIKK
jgi:hypothetical protein